MAIPTNKDDLELKKFKESTATSGQPGVVVVNPDGSSVGGTTTVVTAGTVSGNVASGTTDSGNPVKVGGKYNATPPTLTDGQRGDLQLNAAGAAVSAGIDNFYITKSAPGTFNGTAANARGNLAGTNDPYTLFTVTGDVLAGVYGVASGTMAGAGSISVGPAGNATLMMAAIAGTNIPINSCWMDATPAIGKPVDSLNYYILGNGVDIVEDVSGTNVEGGNIYYVALWKPLSPSSSLVGV